MKTEFNHASESFKRLNPHLFGAARIRAAVPEPDTGGALVGAAPGEAQCPDSTGSRYHITFIIYRTRPLDWDNHFVKPLQDCLVLARLIPDDNPGVLEGSVLSRKVKTKAEERTEIVIERLVPEQPL